MDGLLYAPQLLRTVCFQGLILTSWFNYYQAHIKLFSTTNVSVIDFDTDRLDLSFSGFYPVKVSSLRDFEVLSGDMMRILSYAEIFSFAALKCLQSGNMDSRVFSSPVQSTGRAIVVTLASALALALPFPSRNF